MANNHGTSVRRIAGEIVASYVSNNQMPPEQVPDFIKEILSALDGGGSSAAAAQAQKPAVPVRRSVREDAVLCLECGAAQKTLKRHIQTAHGLSEGDYREKWRLPRSHPLVAPSYSKARASMARKIGLGQKRRGRRDKVAAS